MARRFPPTKASAVKGRVLRPKPLVLSDAALVPEGRLIKPPPNQFTHQVIRRQPYYYDSATGTADGEFAARTHVVLMVYDGGRFCRVVDANGLYVETEYKGLRPLPRRRAQRVRTSP